ncbi:RagB/SusD family nutrient uptake outer membrane protein [Chitinophaga sp. LS1]|uniref:RagB/SusD family nutrient uptake outer membrane protein n=1 Tax=Chitinophaga sp. LS1 TaxID=3051176 RepID=UPI002AAA808F|nr:RagB/SusD family nutrient uptake outer membrane protein [Chitinophaga sp. LS1]WPV63797.1 RagB/SusD family nutrient uptake outer membrane protein [Chitinophaga sp. LS1]
MKQLIIYLLPICLLFSSCKKFLKETSPDEIKPTTTDDLYALMISDAYPYTANLEDFSDILTDDVRSYGMPRKSTGEQNTTYSSYYQNGQGVFKYDAEELDGSEGTAATALNAWARYYSKIKGCNIIIDYIDNVSGTQKDKDALVGQSLLLRAFYYFKLLQLYCAPYVASAASTPGVPLILSMQVSDEHIGRSTLQETFDQVEKDLTQAATLLEANYKTPNAYRVGYIAAYALLSRVYLYKGEWDKAIDYAEKVLAERSQLTDMSLSSSSGSLYIYDQSQSAEVIFQYGSNPSGVTTFFPSPISYSGMHAPYEVADELGQLYENNDLRYKFYFYKVTVSGASYNTRSSKIGVNSKGGDKGIRVAEMYLNAAEGLARRFKSGGQEADRTSALQYLNTLRQNRFSSPYTTIDIQNADSLISFALAERRRELCLEENFRWADIKRLGLSVTHNFIDADGNSTIYTLAANSPLYALPIPVTALERNNKLTQNAR